VVDGFNLAYRQDARFRSAHHGTTVAPASGAGMEARPFETPSVGHERVVWEQDGVRIAAFQVDHSPVHPAVGYRIDFGGRSVVISGDTRQSTELERVAEGVDLLVHEALAARIVAALNEVATSQGRKNLARITADIPDYHTTPVEAAASAERAGAGRLLFYHVVPPLVVPGMEAVFLDGVSEAYSGGVTVGRDGTLVSLPSGSKAIEISSR
jgi:ribonuclease Z